MLKGFQKPVSGDTRRRWCRHHCLGRSRAVSYSSSRGENGAHPKRAGYCGARKVQAQDCYRRKDGEMRLPASPVRWLLQDMIVHIDDSIRKYYSAACMSNQSHSMAMYRAEFGAKMEVFFLSLATAHESRCMSDLTEPFVQNQSL